MENKTWNDTIDPRTVYWIECKGKLQVSKIAETRSPKYFKSSDCKTKLSLSRFSGATLKFFIILLKRNLVKKNIECTGFLFTKHGEIILNTIVTKLIRVFVGWVCFFVLLSYNTLKMTYIHNYLGFQNFLIHACCSLKLVLNL